MGVLCREVLVDGHKGKVEGLEKYCSIGDLLDIFIFLATLLSWDRGHDGSPTFLLCTLKKKRN